MTTPARITVVASREGGRSIAFFLLQAMRLEDSRRPLTSCAALTKALAVHADPEAEELGAVALGLDDREAEVEGDRHRAEHGDGDTHAEAGGDAVVVDAD